MNYEKEQSSDSGVSFTPLEMSSHTQRPRLDNSVNIQEGSHDETASYRDVGDSNLTTSNGEETSEVKSHESYLEFEEIIAIVKKKAAPVQSSNVKPVFPRRKQPSGDPNFLFFIEPYRWIASKTAEGFGKMMEDSYVDYEKPLKQEYRNSDMFEGIETFKDQKNQTPTSVSYTYTEEQINKYNDMKLILETKKFHMYVLTGTGKTVFCKQFYDDPKIDFIYIAAQHSLLKEGCRKLDLNLDTMTFAKLTMIIFGFCADRYKIYSNSLNRIPTTKINEIGLPNMFKLSPIALDVLFSQKKPCRTGNQKLVLCINKFNIINTNELYMIKCALQRLVSAANSKVSLILLLCGDPFEIPPIFRPVSPPIEWGETKFEFKTILPSDNAQYKNFVHNLKNSPHFAKDVLEYFGDAFKVRAIPYKYCIQALLDMPTPGAGYQSDLVGWAQKYDKEFNGVGFYSYENKEVHYMNLAMALSVWKQCQLFNGTAAQRGDKQIPPYLMPRLVRIFFVNTNNQLTERPINKFELVRAPVLPIIIGCRYKVLYSGSNVTLGEIVTLVHVEYKDSGVYKNIRHLLVVASAGDLITVKPGQIEMPLFRDVDDRSERDSSYAPLMQKPLYGFPLQLAFARTVRGSLGPPIEGHIYGNLVGISPGEIYTLLNKIHDPSQIKGLACVQ